MRFEGSYFLRPLDVFKVCTFGPVLGPIYSLKESEIEKSKLFEGKNLSIGLYKYPKVKALSGFNFELKRRLLFPIFGVFLGKNGPKSQKSRGQCSG